MTKCFASCETVAPHSCGGVGVFWGPLSFMDGFQRLRGLLYIVRLDFVASGG